MTRRGLVLGAVLLIGGCYSPEEERQPILEYVVFFRGQSSELDPAARRVLDAAVAAARKEDGHDVRVEGYADRPTVPEPTQILSRLRAQEVADGLTARGVEKARVDLRFRTAIGSDPGEESRRVLIVVRQ